LGGELFSAGLTFSGYAEDLPYKGFTGDSRKNYVRRHNPWVNFSDVPASANRPFSNFPSDFSTLPTVSMVVPNLQHDMEDGSVLAGDRWFQSNLGRYADWAPAHHSLLIVTWD